MSFDVAAVQAAVDTARQSLQGAMLATDVWERSTEETLATFNGQPAAKTMFNALTDSMSAALSNSGFPRIGRYYLVDLEEERTLLVVRHGTDVLQGVLLNASKVNMGLLFSVVIPQLIRDVNAAR